MKKKALITGITGQDGSYLAEFLLSKGYEVHGLVRRASNLNTQRIDHLFEDVHEENRSLFLHFADLSDASRLTTLLFSIRPDEVYHLAAQSHVRVSFDQPEFTGDVTGLATTRLLEGIRLACPETKFYQASSSEMFGATPPPQSETTEFYPRSLGNLDAVRDWGYAPEYVRAMWLMLQAETPEDFVIGTGASATVKDFLDYSFQEAGLDWEKYVKFDDRYVRPTEVDSLIGDASKAKKKLDWKHTLDVAGLASLMVKHDIESVTKNSHVVDVPQFA